MQEQFALAAWVGHGVGGGLLRGRDERADAANFATVKFDKGIDQLHFALA